MNITMMIQAIVTDQRQFFLSILFTAKKSIDKMQTKEEVLQACTIHGTIIKLPETQLDRKLYLEVAKALELIGGKWKGGKTAGFVFNEDPTELLEQIANGGKRNLKKEFQFFATPDHLADRLVELADIKPTDSILEPSAGQGAIIKAIHRKHPAMSVHYYEIMDINRTFLKKISMAVDAGMDFLNDEDQHEFDKIIANPPFSKNQDIDHIYQMYAHLANDGRMVTIAGKHWQISSNKVEKKFREWLDAVNAEIIDIEGGEFKESGTTIATVIIVIDKP
jgi:type I restriction-modification system DNA methylase subunit